MKVRFTDFKSEFLSLEKDLTNSFKNIGKEGSYILGKELENFENKFKTAESHFENVKIAIKTNKLNKIYDIFKKYNNEKLSYPVYEKVLKKYGFE